MTRRAGLLLLLALPGLFLYLWPAFSAPVVLWSDSALDLDWARRGVGIVSPVPPAPPGEEQPAHPAKPAYLLFLRAVTAVAPAPHEERSIVVVQSLLLWLSIAWTSWFVARRRGWGLGTSVYLLLVLLLRLRDAASAVMPEALAAALLLPIAARLLDPPQTRAGQLALGLATALLFWVRPNVGGIALLLALVTLTARREWRGTLTLVGGFALVFVPVWLATRPEASLRGLSRPLFEGSLPYGWMAGDRLRRTSSPEALERVELAAAGNNWRSTLAESGPDVRRELVWRAFHGLLGTEFYDSRWSRAYRLLTEASRAVTPVLILIAAILVLRRSPAGTALLVLIVVQNLALGSRPRFVLPFVPALLLLAVVAGSERRKAPATDRLLQAGVLLLSLVLVAVHSHVLDREWGQIEDGGIEIRQWIRKGSLPRKAPATLHVRLAPPLASSSAHFMVLAPDGTALYRSENEAVRDQPVVTIPLPQALLDVNATEAIRLRIVTYGRFGELDYLLFPVIPPPWHARAHREGSPFLSPSTGLRSGSFDWWAHTGLDPDRLSP